MLKLGIIGHPLEHTLSPVLHGFLMEQLGINGEYCVYDIPPENLPAAIERFHTERMTGVNVTIPHKVAVLPQVNHLSAEARQIGAVNTLAFKADGIHGHNTDVTGFVRSLPAHVITHLPESHILVLGAGGAARAVVYGLLQLNVAAITLAVRNPEKAVLVLTDTERWKEFLQVKTELSIVSLDSLPSLESFSGIVNTTPIGMWPETNASPLPALLLETLPAGAFVYDLIYRPLETRLLKDARQLGYETINGLPMLMHQGVAAFELWQPVIIENGIIAKIESTLLSHIND